MWRNLVVLSGNYPPESGGPSKFAKNFSSWAASEFDNVHVISTHPDKNRRFLDDNVSINLVSRARHLAIRCLATVLRIWKLGKKDSLVIANGLFVEVMIASLVFGTSYYAKIPGDIVWERARTKGDTNLDMYQFQKVKLNKKYALLRFLFTLSLKRAKGVIIPATPLYQICLDWGIDPSKLRVIFNSVNVNKFSPITGGVKEYDIITVSRLIDLKQIDQVIIAASKLKLNLLVVGSGPEEHRLKDLNLSLGSPATFFGNASQEQLPRLYQSARYFVNNSEFEAGTPYSLLEARACGLVCIANELTGAADVIVHNEDGFLCGSMSKSNLLINLDRAMKLESNYESFSKLAQKRTNEAFSEASIYKLIVSYCESL